MRYFAILLCLVTLSVQSAFAQEDLIGDNLNVACRLTKTNDSVSNTAAVNRSAIRLFPLAGPMSTMYVSKGDGKLNWALGKRTIRVVFAQRNGTKVHAYVIAARDPITKQLYLRRLGLIGSANNIMTNADYYTFRDTEFPLVKGATLVRPVTISARVKVNTTQRRRGREQQRIRTRTESFECRLSVID